MLGLAGGIFLSNSNENGESTKLMSCFNDTTEGLFWSKEFWLIKINNTGLQLQQDQKWSIDAILFYGWQKSQQIFCLIIYSGFIIYFFIVESESFPHFLQF